MSLPETFSSIKAKMNSNIPFVIEHMNLSLKDMCSDDEVKAKDKLKATQDYLALYMRLDNEIAREKEQREIMKQRKLNTRIKQAEVNEIEDNALDVGFKPIVQSKFSPTMAN